MKFLLTLFLAALPLAAAQKLLIVSPHGDDFAIYAGGAIARMTSEGWEATLVRVTNDEKHSRGISTAETRVRSVAEVEKAAKILGIREVIHLNYKDGELPAVPETELRARLTTVIRTIRPDAVMTTDPWTRFDDNFDHNKVGRTVEDACWTSGNDKFLPELQRAGLAPYAVPERYYWSAGQRWVNHTVDIKATLARKREALDALPMFTSYRAQRLRGSDRPAEEFHRTKGSGLQMPYADWYVAQKSSGRNWADPTGPARLVKPAPGQGKVLVVVQPHADDFTSYASGTVMQFIEAGYTAYLINVSNDEKDYHGLPYTAGQTIEHNQKELAAVAKMTGIREVIRLNLKNDEMESFPHTELRGRLILAFRQLRPDVVFAYDPWGLYERNPDHERVGQCVSEAAWAAGNEHFHPEHFAIEGIKPHTVRERYYFPRGESDINRYFDISAQLEKKIRLIQGHETMMRSTANKLRDQLAFAGLSIPELKADPDHFYLKLVEVYERNRAASVGSKYGVNAAEHFRYDAEE